MTLAFTKAGANKTFRAQALVTIVTNDHENMFVVQATGPMRPPSGMKW
jgi:hypothetical protein